MTDIEKQLAAREERCRLMFGRSMTAAERLWFLRTLPGAQEEISPAESAKEPANGD
jgi:hypothetical protein